jgi:hypothetical protein
MVAKVYQAPKKGDKMKPQSNRPRAAKVKVLNKPQHTLTAEEAKDAKLVSEPSEVTCPIVRETL